MYQLSEHRLAIEKGRYRRPPEEETLCFQGVEVETELNFLTSCPILSQLPLP